jgi:RecA-family ATPase
MSYREGTAFQWPKDRAKIIEHMKTNEDNDLYWCPMLFEYPRRQAGVAMDEKALWADLDEVDPHGLSEYQPTIAWETSPGRFQALWLVSSGDILGASRDGDINQAMTDYIGADPSGWDITQLLRIPGWKNHKPEYRSKDGKPKQGKLLWTDGRQYGADEFNDLPRRDVSALTGEVLEDEISRIDRHEVWGRVRLKVSKRVRELVTARAAAGDRSDALWEIERDLADAGCTIPEIVVIVKATVWNKFEGRADELRRLISEASKAVSQRSQAVSDALEEEFQERPKPINIFEFVRNIKAPQWLIRDVLTQGAVGFIAGQPKLYKSWCALDMALSVASGQPFLGHFHIERPGPTLYIQEEDSPPLVKSRLSKVWPSKLADKVTRSEDNSGDLFWIPGPEVQGYIDCDAYVGQGFVMSSEGWQAWLDETLAAKEGGYRLLVLDPLMMMAGDVEENRAQEMTTKIFKPLKELARKHEVAVQWVHHMRKGDPKSPQRGGQMLLGSVANHAWAEDSMYLKYGRGGNVLVEQESKNAPVPGFTISRIRNRQWTPEIKVNKDEDIYEPEGVEGRPQRRKAEPKVHPLGASPRADSSHSNSRVLKALHELGEGPQSVRSIADSSGVSITSVYATAKRAMGKGYMIKVGTQFQITKKGIEAIS